MTGGRWPVPKSWEWVSAKDIATIVGGGTPKANDPENFSNDGIKWITPADLTGYSSAYISGGRRDLSEKGYSSSGASLLPKGTVLFTSRAPVGYCVIAANKISTNQGFKSLVLEGNISPEFIRHYLLASKEYAESLASGTTFLELSGKRMGELQIPLPPLAEQRRIVHKLDRLTAHSTTARTHLTALKTLVERYRLAIIDNAFSMLDLSIPLIEAVEKDRGIPYGIVQTGKHTSGGVPTVRAGDIKQFTVGKDALKLVSKNVSDQYARTILRGGEVLIAIRGSVGETCVVPKDMAGCNISREVALVPVRDGFDARFVMFFLKSQRATEFIRVNVKGIAQTGINLRDLRKLLLPALEYEEQREIVRRIDAAFARIDLLAGEAERALKLLGHLDQRILERAFCGGLVSQNPEDEPAAALLARIKTTRAATPAKKRRGRTKA